MADERDRLRRQLGLSPTPTPVTADADPLAATNKRCRICKLAKKMNIEIAIALEQAVNTGDKNAMLLRQLLKQGGSATTPSNAMKQFKRCQSQL
jgi:hypothetical protein